MSLKAGFAEVDITPPVGTHKIGWLKKIVSDRVLDPLFARACVLEAGGERVGIVQLDTLLIDAGDVAEIRERISAEHGVAGGAVMVAATHNHAGPAVADSGDTLRDAAYVEALTAKVVSVFGEALAAAREAEIGFARGFRFDIGFNRRVVMRDGTVRTHGTFADPEALFIEGPVDPEVAVLAARGRDGALLGALVNFACHPAHHGGDESLSAGYPGVLAGRMKRRSCPVTMFLLGAAGNIACPDPAHEGRSKSMEEAGELLAGDVSGALERMEFTGRVRLRWRSRLVRLPFRELAPEQLDGTARGAQRFIDPAIYDRAIPAQIERIRRLGAETVEVQVLLVNDVALVAIPGEYFVELGLRIKQRAYPARAVVVSCANGQLGYIPTREAFSRGGYETTFGPPSCLAAGAGELLAEAAVELIAEGRINTKS